LYLDFFALNDKFNNLKKSIFIGLYFKIQCTIKSTYFQIKMINKIPYYKLCTRIIMNIQSKTKITIAFSQVWQNNIPAKFMKCSWTEHVYFIILRMIVKTDMLKIKSVNFSYNLFKFEKKKILQFEL